MPTQAFCQITATEKVGSCFFRFLLCSSSAGIEQQFLSPCAQEKEGEKEGRNREKKGKGEEEGKFVWLDFFLKKRPTRSLCNAVTSVEKGKVSRYKEQRGGRLPFCGVSMELFSALWQT